jgi:hypothetical protein
MIDLSHLQLLAQLFDNMDLASKSLEKAYNNNDSEMFSKAKMEILDIQKKISREI